MIDIRRGTTADAAAIAKMADELLREIMAVIGLPSFDSDPQRMRDQLCQSIPIEHHFVLIAERVSVVSAADATNRKVVVGFAALSPAYSLYTHGPFGLITELYVDPEFRSQSIGQQLLSACESFAATKGWSQLEVTTPPLPEFDRTIAFYQRHGFEITGGRKLKRKTAAS